VKFPPGDAGPANDDGRNQPAPLLCYSITVAVNSHSPFHFIKPYVQSLAWLDTQHHDQL